MQTQGQERGEAWAQLQRCRSRIGERASRQAFNSAGGLLFRSRYKNQLGMCRDAVSACITGIRLPNGIFETWFAHAWGEGCQTATHLHSWLHSNRLKDADRDVLDEDGWWGRGGDRADDRSSLGSRDRRSGRRGNADGSGGLWRRLELFEVLGGEGWQLEAAEVV